MDSKPDHDMFRKALRGFKMGLDMLKKPEMG
jgi:hypothetical protein